jgi:hypothetical protein
LDEPGFAEWNTATFRSSITGFFSMLAVLKKSNKDSESSSEILIRPLLKTVLASLSGIVSAGRYRRVSAKKGIFAAVVRPHLPAVRPVAVRCGRERFRAGGGRKM